MRFPAAFRFPPEVNEVYVRRDERTDDVILSTQPRSLWTGFMAVRAQLGVCPVPDDFLADR